MEFVNNPRNPAPRPSGTGGAQPQRRVFNDFVARPTTPHRPRPTTAATPAPAAKPAVPIQPVPTAQSAPTAQPSPMLRPATTLKPVAQPTAVPTPGPRPFSPPPAPPSASDQATDSILKALEPSAPTSELGTKHAELEDKPDKPHAKAHGGLVGLITFVLLTGLLVSPLLPGKTLDNFPGNSQTSSVGGQTIACLNELKDVSTSTAYTTRLGSPIVYRYATATTERATCDGALQTAIIGSDSQFNPLGLLADTLLAIVVAAGIGKLWSVVFGRLHKT